MSDRKVPLAKKIFYLGFSYSWTLTGENNQRCHSETIQIKQKQHQCFERIHTMRILSSVLCVCVYFEWLCCSFGGLLKKDVGSQFKRVSARGSFDLH